MTGTILSLAAFNGHIGLSEVNVPVLHSCFLGRRGGTVEKFVCCLTLLKIATAFGICSLFAETPDSFREDFLASLGLVGYLSYLCTGTEESYLTPSLPACLVSAIDRQRVLIIYI